MIASHKLNVAGSAGIQVTDEVSAKRLVAAWAGNASGPFYIRAAAESAELWGNHQSYETTQAGANLRKAAEVLRAAL